MVHNFCRKERQASSSIGILNRTYKVKYRKNYKSTRGTLRKVKRKSIHFCVERGCKFAYYRAQGHKKNCEPVWDFGVTKASINGPIAQEIYRD